MTTSKRGRTATAMAAAVMALAGLAACGDDDGGGDTAAACDAFVAIDREISINEDFEAGVAAIQTFTDAAPDDVADQMQPLVELLEQDPEAAFESEELVMAETAADRYALDNCGDTTVELEAVNYAFTDAPSEVDAGRVAFSLTNHSQTDEAHEALLLRKNDDVTGSAHDAVASALGDQPVSVETPFGAFEGFSLVGASVAEPPGGDAEDVFVVDLDPGEYILVCMLPVGSAELGEAYFMGEQIDADYHFEEGMFAEFTVD
jgi:hypothetical protein